MYAKTPNKNAAVEITEYANTRTNFAQITETIQKHKEKINSTIPLVASENLTSPAARLALMSDFQHRYSLGLPGNKATDGQLFANMEFIEKIEQILVNSAKKLFHAEKVDPRYLSGANCTVNVLFSLTKSGDSIMRVGDDCGGHFSTAPVCERLGVKVNNLIFDFEEMTIDVEKTVKLVKQTNPKILFIDSSHLLFPHPIKELRKELPNQFIIYDGSHVLGLIAGQQFQQPLKEGSNFLQGTTHKTFPGPQKAILASEKNSKEFDIIEKKAFPFLVSNNHSHHTVALAITLLEMEKFGEDYAKQIIKNSKALAENLVKEGIGIVGENKGYTESHQVWIKSGTENQAINDFYSLTNASIAANKIMLPFGNDFGLRLGTGEITRKGLKETDMEVLAMFIADSLKQNKNTKNLNKEIKEFMGNFTKIKYCFSETDTEKLFELLNVFD